MFYMIQCKQEVTQVRPQCKQLYFCFPVQCMHIETDLITDLKTNQYWVLLITDPIIGATLGHYRLIID